MVLPYTSEGYKCPKTIVAVKFGTPRVVVNAHIQGIMPLPTINDTHPQKSFREADYAYQHFGYDGKT